MLHTVRRFVLRCAAFVRPTPSDEAMRREIASHLALLEGDYRARGMSPDDAAREARRALGNLEALMTRVLGTSQKRSSARCG